MTAFLTVCAFIRPRTSVQVLPPVGPADAATRHLPSTEVHRLDSRRVDEHLDEWARLGQVGDQVGIELDGEIRLRMALGVELEVAGPQHRPDDAQEAAQDAVLVEALDGVDRSLDLSLESTRVCVAAIASYGVEAQMEELDESSCDLG